MASGGISKQGAEPDALEGYAVLSLCHLCLSRRQGGEMPSGGGHVLAVRAAQVALGAQARSACRSKSY
jgi:hypothetical protein